MFINYYRATILGFNVGFLIWLITIINILYGNYKEKTSRKTLAIIFLFICWAADVAWELFLTIIRILDQEPAALPLALGLKITVMILTSAAITNFMFVHYGNYLKRRFRRWLGD